MSKYKELSRPPIDALRQIQAGDLKGKTDINPQWRYEAMDAAFGACGEGWRYEIVRLWDYPTNDGTILCFAQINLYLWLVECWSEPIPGVGGNTLVDMVNIYDKNRQPTGEKKPKPNDEGYKMAITDALSTAMKMIGVAADIYRGNYDGSKYRQEQPRAEEQKQTYDTQKMEALAAIMKKTRSDGSAYFTETQKAGYKKKIAVYGLDETIKQAEIALEEMEAAE